MTPNGSDETSVMVKARLAGALYVIVVITAGFAEAIARGRVIVSGDAATTATNIMAHQTLYRLGGAADMVNLSCDIALAVLFYILLKPVSRPLALLSSIYKLTGDVMTIVAVLAHFLPFVFLTTAPYLTAFTPAQLQVQAFVWVRVHGQAYNVAMVFFGLHCIVLGYLVYRSTFLPRIIGALLVMAGVCYLVLCYTRFISPPSAAPLFPYILWPGILAEAAMALWLLIAGVNAERWNVRAAIT